MRSRIVARPICDFLLPREMAMRRSYAVRRTTLPNTRLTPVVHKDRLGGRSKVPLYIGGLFVYGVSIYLGSLFYSLSTTKTTKDEKDSTTVTSTKATYDAIAPHYDADMDFDEWLLGMPRLRRSLIRHARGTVLEVSAGTGRNLAYYDTSAVTRLTLVDQSDAMLSLARARVGADDTWQNRQVDYVASSLEDFEGTAKYDTVVQTFGLCSVQHPEAFLATLAQLCKDGGRIILLEHGRSKWRWLNSILDKSVAAHAEKWGCYYNRDISAIVDTCPNVEIVEASRSHAGTTFYYILRPVVPSL